MLRTLVCIHKCSTEDSDSTGFSPNLFALENKRQISVLVVMLYTPIIKYNLLIQPNSKMMYDYLYNDYWVSNVRWKSIVGDLYDDIEVNAVTTKPTWWGTVVYYST